MVMFAYSDVFDEIVLCHLEGFNELTSNLGKQINCSFQHPLVLQTLASHLSTTREFSEPTYDFRRPKYASHQSVK